MLFEPNRTKFDIEFKVGKIPVRIHPLFWLITAVLGLSGRMDGIAVAIVVSLWVSAVFVSILVHELGHALVAKRYGWPPHIVLYGMGGLAIYQPSRQTPLQRILIAAAGPGAGFVLAAITGGIVLATGHALDLGFGLTLGSGGELPGRIGLFVQFMMFINLFWGLLNLMPIQPLDGGTITQTLLGKFRPAKAVALSYQVSMVAAGVIAVAGLALLRSPFIAVMFALLGYQSWHMLNQLRNQGMA